MLHTPTQIHVAVPFLTSFTCSFTLMAEKQNQNPKLGFATPLFSVSKLLRVAFNLLRVGFPWDYFRVRLQFGMNWKLILCNSFVRISTLPMMIRWDFIWFFPSLGLIWLHTSCHELLIHFRLYYDLCIYVSSINTLICSHISYIFCSPVCFWLVLISGDLFPFLYCVNFGNFPWPICCNTPCHFVDPFSAILWFVYICFFN